MSVVIETTLGDITVDLFLSERPRACLNFLKLCKIKYYNYNLFHTISRGFIAQAGDPTGSRSGGESMFGVLDGSLKRFFEAENEPRIKHTKMGLISFVGNEECMIGSQFFLTLGEDLTYLDEKHCVFGEVVEGFDVLEIINEVICDTDDRPYQDVRITHTVILDDPYPDPKRLIVPSRSPSPSVERLQGGRIAPDEEVDETEGKTTDEVVELQAEREAKARATILEMVGDLPDAEMAPPENVLFVCKLNPVTNDDDLEIIFSRFGKIKSCEVIRDKKTGDSLQYAFVEFEDQKACEDAYFKMDNVLIDDRRIHVDFSQSVSKVKWHGKGRGVTHYDKWGNRTKKTNNDVGKGNYTHKSENYGKRDDSKRNKQSREKIRDRLRSPKYKQVRSTTSTNNSRSPGRDINKSKNKRDSSLSPRRKRDVNSPKRSESRDYRDKYPAADEKKARRNKDISLSPKRSKSPPQMKSKDAKRNKGILLSPKREPSGSKNYKEKQRDKSRSPSRSSERKNKQYQSQKYVETKSMKTSSSDRSHSLQRKKVEDRRERSASRGKHKLKIRKGSHSNSDDEAEEVSTKRNSKYSSRSYGDSSTDKKAKIKKYSSDSSESDDNKKEKLKKKKDLKKSRYDSSTDSDDYKRRSKKKKKYESDSD